MTSVSDPDYQVGLREFARRLRLVHRNLGDPPYEAVAKACGVSVTTVHRYLTGKTLPPWRFVARYADRVPFLDEAPEQQVRLNAERGRALPADAVQSLHTVWADTRNVLRPIDGPASNSRMGQLYQLPGLPGEQEDPGEPRRRPA